MVDHLPKSATHYFTPKKFDHFCPQREKRLLKRKKKKKRNRGREWGGGESDMVWENREVWRGIYRWE